MAGGFRVVKVLTLGAVELDALSVGNIGQSGRKKVLGLAVDAGAFAKIAGFVFLKLSSAISISVLRSRYYGRAAGNLPSSVDHE